MANTTHDPNVYYVPHGSKWPLVGSVGLFLTVGGFANWMNGSTGLGQVMSLAGVAILLWMMWGWFGDVIRESVRGMYNRQVGVSFRIDRKSTRLNSSH